MYWHVKNRLPMADVDFLTELSTLGLECKEVREHGAPSPPPSPPFFESLFPDQRIAIWRIQRSQHPFGDNAAHATFQRPIFSPPD